MSWSARAAASASSIPAGDSENRRATSCARKLVEITGEGGLLRDLAKRRDRDCVTHVAAVRSDRPSWSTTSQVRRVRLAGGEREDEEAPATGDLDRENRRERGILHGSGGRRNLLELFAEAHACQDRPHAVTEEDTGARLVSPAGLVVPPDGRPAVVRPGPAVASIPGGTHPLRRRSRARCCDRDGAGRGAAAGGGHPVVGLDQSATCSRSRGSDSGGGSSSWRRPPRRSRSPTGSSTI